MCALCERFSYSDLCLIMNRNVKELGEAARMQRRQDRQAKYWIQFKKRRGFKVDQAERQKTYRQKHKNSTDYRIRRREWSRVYLKKLMQNETRRIILREKNRIRLQRFRARRDKMRQ